MNFGCLRFNYCAHPGGPCHGGCSCGWRLTFFLKLRYYTGRFAALDDEHPCFNSKITSVTIDYSLLIIRDYIIETSVHRRLFILIRTA